MNQLAVNKFITQASKILLLLALIAIGLSSCKSNGDIIPYAPPANLNIVNTAPDSLNVYQNGARINNISTISPGSQSGYTVVASGAKIYQVKKNGASTYLINNLPLTLDTTAYYSLFIAGETSDQIFLANDALPAGAANSSLIRFVNASPATTNLDVTIGTLTFSNQPFKAVTAFSNLLVSSSTNVTIYLHGSTTPLFKGTTLLSAGAAYTLYTKGIPSGTGSNVFTAVINTN